MTDRSFAQQITDAARLVARLDLKRRKARQRLGQIETEYRGAQRGLRLIVSAIDPYEPPDPELARRANDAADRV